MCLILELQQTCGDDVALAAHRQRSHIVNFMTNYLMLDTCSQLEPQEAQQSHRRGVFSSVIVIVNVIQNSIVPRM
jgi:hypothetical protein